MADVSEEQYLLAVNGRMQFRKAYRQARAEAKDYRAAICDALRHLDHATPQQRNGPVYQAADALRAAIGLPAMPIGSKPSMGLPSPPEDS